MKIRYLFVLLLAGCTANTAPLVSDVSDSAVKIQAGTSVPMAEVDAKAAEACARYGKTRSDALSSRLIEGEWAYYQEALYSCL